MGKILILIVLKTLQKLDRQAIQQIYKYLFKYNFLTPHNVSLELLMFTRGICS